MSRNVAQRMNDLYVQFAAGALSRRELVQAIGALGVSAAAVSVFMRGIPASAQDASPASSPEASPVASPVGSPAASPVASYEPFTSINREQYKALLAEWWATQERPFEEPQNQGGEIVQGETSFVATTNLMMGSDNLANVTLGLINETLVFTSPIDGAYVPALADYWTIAEDGKTYTFYLNQNVRWHDGTPFTSADVVFSMDIQANPATSTTYQSTFVATVALWTALDDYTVQLVATDVFVPLAFYGNAYCPIMPKHLWETVAPENWASNPGSTGEDLSRVVGTGPFRMTEYNASEQRLVLEKNADYYDTVPVIDRFIYITSGDGVAQIEALRAGVSDIVEAVSPADTQGLIDEEALDVLFFDTLDFSFYLYNLDASRTTLFQDVRVRRALFYAIDRQSIIDNILLGYAERAIGTQPLVSPAYAPDRITTDYVYDVERARALLAEAGWVDSDGDGVVELNGQPLAFDLMHQSGLPDIDAIVAKIQEDWAAVGAQITLNSVDFSTVLVPTLTDRGDFDTVYVGFGWDPTGDQSAVFTSGAVAPNGFNAMLYSNPRVDELSAASSKELDEQKRIDLLVEASNLVNEDLPAPVMWFRKNRVAYNVRLHNFAPNAYGLLWSLNWVWVDA